MMEENDNERLGDNINHTAPQDVGYSQFQGPEEIRPSFLPSPASFNPSNSVSIGNNQFSVPTGFVTGPPPGYQTQSKMVMETEPAPMENMGNPMTQPPFLLPPPHFGMRAGHMPPMRMFDHFNHPPPDMMPRPRTTLPPPSAFYQDPSMFNLFRTPILPPRHEVNDTDGGRFNHFYNHKTNEASESKSSVEDNMTSTNKEEFKNTPGANESLDNKTNAAHQFMDTPTTSDPEVATSETFDSEVRQDLQTSGQQMAMPQSNRPVIDENLEKMAADWSEHRNETGRVYYYNSKTMESTWEMPAVLLEYREKQRLAHSNGFLMTQTNQISAEEEERMKQEAKAAEEERKRKKQQEASKPIFTRAVPATPWCMVWTKDGRIFFHNPSSGTSLWNCPPDLAGRPDVQMWMAEEPPTVDQKDSKRSGSPIMKKQKMGSEATATSTISSTSHFPSLQNVQQTGYPPNFQGIHHHHQQNQMVDGDTSKQTTQVNESNSATLDKSSSEEKLQKFMELLEEKQVSVFSTWEKELPKLVFDPRYLMLPAKERRPAFEQYLRTRCDEERKEKLHKMKVKKDEFKRLLLESNMTGKWTFLDFCSKFSRDERFKAIEKMKERESLFNEFITDVRKREKMGTKNALEQAKKDFIQMLKEKVPLGLLRPGNHWQDARIYVQSDSRYRLVMHHPTQAGEWYREMCNSGPQEEGSDEGELVDEIDEKMRKERVRQERVEASLRERQKAVQESLYASLMERDKERKTHMREESVQHFKALMADMVKSADVSWRDTRHALRKDDRWALAKHLEREEKEQLFEEHVANLTKKNRMAYHKLLDEMLSGSLTTTWKEIRKKIRDDPRCTKFSSHEKKREKEFDEYLVQRRSKAKQEFKDLLRETRLINHRAAELASETGQQQMKDIVVILQKDKRYLVLDSMPEERMDILIGYINELSKRAPSPPPTASDPRSRNPIR